MRTSVFAVAAIVIASSAIDQARAADRIPAFDIVQNCNTEVANVGTEKVADCTKDETDAQACVGESSTGAAQSYVELLTCLATSTGSWAADVEFFKERRRARPCLIR
ncbi:hypothetical protein H8A95_18740 [Bradyrhizobium sp. Pear76]|uniref:hypothetical protein n=1 Tax=Bradyrhizobium oropedii TaxID=1571201 RepID=UPI001E297536|nr:hypothetical protein [Bradyrhizobium oropedii]MCC8964300.1 hypothetical protein [Bradyrhizobium oropedii]